MSLPVPDSILILGPGKSGTTALYEAIRAGATRHHGSPVPVGFEPRSTDALRAMAQPRCVVKMLAERLPLADLAHTRCFARRVFIYRDPRDNIVSRLTWRIWSALAPGDTVGRQTVLEALREKEFSPAAVSVRSLFELIARLSQAREILDNTARFSVMPAEILRADRDFFPLRYEDFIRGDLGALSAHLGFDVAPTPMPEKNSHLRRSARSGDWKHWFTPEDVAFFVTPQRAAYLELGFDPEEAPASEPVIEPEFSSGFVQSQFDRLDRLAAPG